MSFLERHALLVAGGAGGLSALRTCDLLFACGCTWFSVAHCNHLDERGPHCPWCMNTVAFGLSILAAILASAGAIAIARRFLGRRAPSTLAAGLLGWAIGIFAAGAVTALATGYPHFLG